MALMANQEGGEERIPDDGELEGSDNFVKVDNHYRIVQTFFFFPADINNPLE